MSKNHQSTALMKTKSVDVKQKQNFGSQPIYYSTLLSKFAKTCFSSSGSIHTHSQGMINGTNSTFNLVDSTKKRNEEKFRPGARLFIEYLDKYEFKQKRLELIRLIVSKNNDFLNKLAFMNNFAPYPMSVSNLIVGETNIRTFKHDADQECSDSLTTISIASITNRNCFRLENNKLTNDVYYCDPLDFPQPATTTSTLNNHNGSHLTTYSQLFNRNNFSTISLTNNHSSNKYCSEEGDYEMNSCCYEDMRSVVSSRFSLFPKRGSTSGSTMKTFSTGFVADKKDDYNGKDDNFIESDWDTGKKWSSKQQTQNAIVINELARQCPNIGPYNHLYHATYKSRSQINKTYEIDSNHLICQCDHWPTPSVVYQIKKILIF